MCIILLFGVCDRCLRMCIILLLDVCDRCLSLDMYYIIIRCL